MVSPQKRRISLSMALFFFFVCLPYGIYFFMIAPQRKREKKINEFRNNIKKGDAVVTIGGIHGHIRDIKENTFIIEITDGVRITVDKNAIAMS